MYYKDDAGRMDAFCIREDGGQLPNAGHLAHQAHFKLSCEFDMIGRIHADIFFQERYMLNEVGIKVHVVRSKDAFCLLGDTRGDAKVKLNCDEGNGISCDAYKDGYALYTFDLTPISVNTTISTW